MAEYEKISHGVIPPLERLQRAEEAVNDLNRDTDLPFSFAITSRSSAFDYLFPDLQSSLDARLPDKPETYAQLRTLGVTMREPGAGNGNSAIPSAYTYLGQFIDHDITLEAKSDSLVRLREGEFRVLTLEEIRAKIMNGRTPGLDLDNLYYKPAPRDCSRMLLGHVSSVDPENPARDRANDLPRRPPRPNDRNHDRAALIGDKRDDENLIIAQLHVAFLRAHNAIVRRGHTFDEARRLLRRHYQWIVIHDFLPRICSPLIVNSVLVNGNRFFRTDPDELFMPFEFSVAAYRFGHSMVRNRYRYNDSFPQATLKDLFTLTALSGDLRHTATLPENWIIDWKNFLDGGPNCARPIDTGLSAALFDLTEFNKPMPHEARLSVRNLLRGYMLRLPTAQAVAAAVKVRVMRPAEIEEIAASVSRAQLNAVRAGGFSECTPLWYYILAEAAAEPSDRLGPLGSTLVAEVLIGLIRGSKDSILRKKDWQPTLGTTPGRFDLCDLLELAGVLN